MDDLNKMVRVILDSIQDAAFGAAADFPWHADVVLESETHYAIRSALLTAPPGYVLVPVELAGRLQASIGAFVSDEGWGAADMETADDLSALLAAASEMK